MKVRRRGGLSLELLGSERLVMTDLFDQLTALLDEPDDADDEVVRRLYPDAYPDDSTASAEFRELTRTSAQDGRNARISRCRAEVATNGIVDLSDADDANRWIQTVNDVRLAVGTRLGVSADSDPDVDLGDITDPVAQQWAAYHWLTAMQDQLVTALMR